MRILITGINGFVGSYLCEYIITKDVEIFGTSRKKYKSQHDNIFIYKLDLLNKDDLIEMLKKVKPDIIFHLAAQSSVGYSWKNKQETLNYNIISSLNLFESVVELDINCKIISVGSSEEYGLFKNASFIQEDQKEDPLSPYGLSKLTVSIMARQFYKAYGLNILHTRTFPHVGPRQGIGFVTQDFASKIVSIEEGKSPPQILVGNLEAIRDFTDVRDIVKAYWELALNGVAGEIFNVCSGRGFSIKEILDKFLDLAKVKIEVVVDQEKLRPSDVPYMVGSNKKILETTSWTPQISIDKSLLDILNYYRQF